ncbi:hypothetical protein G5V59_12565 [Nocardioides sp. W3-2-3]|uniref:hypothetical protein n=1 Tax=Nocardioides convexus TaxID=2712224 RepID=UPI0024181796|nr:hypothetical protein [Nocardioides convexus]NHA00573.1 hypothetical protein [Nocardioides convexus]
MSVLADEVEAPAEDDVRAVTEDVWLSLLGEEEVLLPRPVPPGSPFDASGTWSAAVTVSGGWQGVVTVEPGRGRRPAARRGHARPARGRRRRRRRRRRGR